MGVLDGKGAIVTGAGRGIGRGHCLHLAAAGAGVIVNDVDIEEARKVVVEIEKAGGRAAANGSDVSSRKGAEELVAQCVTTFGNIDIVVNNAGIVRDRSFLKMTDEEFDDVFRVHVKGTFLCSQVAANRMREQGRGGSIVNTVSAAHWGNFGQTNYGGAKGAIASMTYTMAIELARSGIRVNAISPAGTTRMSATFKGPDGTVVEAPFMDPALNGPMVVFLCSDDASYITGQVFATGSDRVLIMAQPRYGTGMFRDGGWTFESIRERFPQVLRERLEPLGITKRPYPYYGGIKPE
jgi:3-oxoacyl-[acyl-carrier protein] reductase